MGVSTDAILFYGYCWEDEEKSSIYHAMMDPGFKVIDAGDNFYRDDREDDEWFTWLARKRGHINPWNNCVEPDNMDYISKRNLSDKWALDHRKEIDAYYKIEENIQKEYNVTVDSHCSYDCPILFIASKESIVRAHRGFPKRINTLYGSREMDVGLDKFIKEFDIIKPHENPQWWLVSFWG